MATEQAATSGDLIDVHSASPAAARKSEEGTAGSDNILTRIRSHSKTHGSTAGSLGIHRTSTRESHHSTGSEGGGGLSSLISNTRSLFKRTTRSGSTSTPSPTETASSNPTTAASRPLESAGFTGRTSPPSASTGSESRRLSSAAGPTSIELPPPIAPDRAFTPPPLRPTAGNHNSGSDGARSSSDNATATTSSSSSIPGYSSSAATTVSDVSSISSPNADHYKQGQQQQQQSQSSALPDSQAGTSSRDFALPAGGAAMPMSTEARYKALPRLQSYSVTHPNAGSEDGDHPDYDTTTSMSGTETEHDDTEHDDEESEAEEGEGEEEEDDDEHDHDEEDVRGGVSAMRTALRRPALPTLSSTRGFSRTANTPGASPATNTNPFNFQGWTTFASSTPTPGPLRTARPQSGDNTMNGSYFDPRPTSSSSRASTVFQTPAQTPRGDTAPGPSGSAGKSRQQPINLPTPSTSISPPASRIRVDASSRPGSGSPLTHSRKPSAGTFVRTANGQNIPMSSIPSIAGLSPSRPGSDVHRPSFYQRQSKSLVDLSRSLDLADSGASEPSVAKPGIPAASGTEGGSTANTAAGPPAPSSTVVDASAAQPDTAQAAEAEESAEDSNLELEAAAAQAELGNSQVAPGAVSPPAPAPAAATASGSRNQSPTRQLQRRQSMPEMRIDPPLYQIDDDFNISYREGQLPSAREDEGREALPSYTCDVHIEGYVPRKMEFVRPGIQAKDRRWKRQYVILHGTSVKVYKSDPRLKAVPGEEPPPTPGIHTDKHRPRFSSVSSKASTGSRNAVQQAHSRSRAPTESSISSASSVDSEKALMWNRAVQDAIAKKKYDPDMPVHVHLQEEDEHGLASLQHPSTLLAKASENRCIRHYTLQGAESGLAADYLKRRHVVRVRAEGEQFLIQCKDDRAVIDWIEALQAATNTALDLDVRPLPKFITLPRRRRRRRPADAANGNASTTAAAGATGNGTGQAAVGTQGAVVGASRTEGQEVSARSDAMNAMLAEDQDAYLGSNRTALG